MASRSTAKQGWLTMLSKERNNNTNISDTQENAVSRKTSNNGQTSSPPRKLPPLKTKSRKTPKQRSNSTSNNKDVEDKQYSGKTSVNDVPHADKMGPHANDVAPTGPVQDDTPDHTFPTVVRTIQMASSWLKKSRKISPQPRTDSFLDRLEMFGPSVTLGMGPSQDDTSATKKWIIDPSGRFLLGWMVIVSTAVLYNLIFIIARQCFHVLHHDYKVLWFVLDYTCDVIYVMDILCQFRTAYLDQGLLVKDLQKLRGHYMKSKFDFKLDVLSILPYDLLYFAAGTNQTIVRIPRILRGYRVMQLFQKCERKTRYPNLLRSCVVVLVFSLVFHWNACFYFAISETIGFGTDKWVYPNPLTSSEYGNLSRQYLYCVHWSARMMVTGETENPPQTDMELLFVIVDLILGYLIFAALIGQFGAILSQMMRNRVDFLNDSETIQQYLHNNHVSEDQQKRVVSWIDYMWQTKQSFDQDEVLHKLPEKLRAQITIHVHLETLRRVALFSDCEPGLLRNIVVKLKSQVYSPWDYICRKGDVGKEMYIVKSGCLQVLGSDGLTVLATLSEGSYFGEISILNLSEIGNRRTADVRSVGFSDLLCLSKNVLLDVLTDYPDARTMLEERGRNLLKQTSQKPTQR